MLHHGGFRQVYPRRNLLMRPAVYFAQNEHPLSYLGQCPQGRHQGIEFIICRLKVHRAAQISERSLWVHPSLRAANGWGWESGIRRKDPGSKTGAPESRIPGCI